MEIDCGLDSVELEVEIEVYPGDEGAEGGDTSANGDAGDFGEDDDDDEWDDEAWSNDAAEPVIEIAGHPAMTQSALGWVITDGILPPRPEGNAEEARLGWEAAASQIARALVDAQPGRVAEALAAAVRAAGVWPAR